MSAEEFTGYKKFESTDFKGEKRTCYTKSVGCETYYAASVEDLKEMCESHREPTEASKKLTEKAIEQFGTNH